MLGEGQFPNSNSSSEAHWGSFTLHFKNPIVNSLAFPLTNLDRMNLLPFFWLLSPQLKDIEAAVIYLIKQERYTSATIHYVSRYLGAVLRYS